MILACSIIATLGAVLVWHGVRRQQEREDQQAQEDQS